MNVMSMVCGVTLAASCWVGLAASAQSPLTLEAAVARIAVLETRVAELEAECDGLRSMLAAAGDEAARLEVVAGLTAKSEMAADAASRFDVSFDAHAGRTRVVGPVLEVPSNRRMSNTRFLMAPAVSFAGELPAEPASAFDLFVATRANTNNRLRLVESVRLRVDGEVLDVPVAEYLEEGRAEPTRGAGRARRGVMTFDERLRLVLDRPAMTRLAHATDASIDLDGLELALTREHVAVVKAVLLRGTPSP